MDWKRIIFAILAIIVLSWVLRYVQNMPTTSTTTNTSSSSTIYYKNPQSQPKAVVIRGPAQNYNSYKSSYYN